MHIHHGLVPNQVLQRNHRGLASATITGETTQSGKVIATIRGLRGWQARLVGVAKRGKFFARLSRLPVDGPIRVWLDDREIHNNPNGNNPVVADEAVVPMRLTAGNHRLTVAMDHNGGLAWGFTLRWLYADGYADPKTLVWPTAD